MMHTLRFLVLASAVLAAALWGESTLTSSKSAAADDPKENASPKKPKGKFTIGKDTTYVTGPLDKDGYVDYAAALNERLSKGVTPENNANVLLWKALGPHPDGRAMPAEYFKLLGIKAPPEKGDSFIELTRYLNEQVKVENAKECQKIEEQLDHARRRPWGPQAFPKLATWLSANEKPLALVTEASNRSAYFSPLIATKLDEPVPGLMGVRLPTVQSCRYLATALVVRAMLQLSQGKAEDAWRDLLACHRLARLVGKGATLVECLVAFAVDAMACRGDLVFLARTKQEEKQIGNCQRDLQDLLPLPQLTEKVDQTARLMFLDTIMMLHRHGDFIGTLRRLEGLSTSKSDEKDTAWEKILLELDWDEALRNGNRWYDKLSVALAMNERGPRIRRLDQFNKALGILKGDILSGDAAKQVKSGKISTGKLVTDILASMLVPSVRNAQDSADRAQQTYDNVILAFALARYQREHGYYPKDLAALAPKYLERIPQDLFSGQALIYRPNENGYLLYSVGVNGKDEDGRGSEDDPPGDDLSVRMPLPEPRPK
jgi:hypothetical protein